MTGRTAATKILITQYFTEKVSSHKLITIHSKEPQSSVARFSSKLWGGHYQEIDQDIFAFFKEPVSTTPADVRIKCIPSVATQEASDFRWGCTDSQIFFF